jgi:protocatechuate 3,4-dioxygenase beta subunit
MRNVVPELFPHLSGNSARSGHAAARVLSRRGFLLAGVTGSLALTAINAFPATPGCTLIGEQEEGPYYVDDETLRRNITEGKPGVPLELAIMLVDARSCRPLRNAALDIWHCDATGVYSGFTAASPDGGPGGRGPGGPPPQFDGGGPGGGFGPGGPGGPGGRGGPGFGRGSRQIDPTRFLRGVQLTDDSGRAEFSTLYPGWYSGRAIHIHVKAHIGGTAAAKYAGGHVAHTGQFFFPEDLTERIARVEPYAKRLSVHRTTQAEDHVFNEQHGADCMLTMERLGKNDSDGFRATVTLAVDPEATPSSVGVGGRGRGPGGPPPGRG